MEIDAIKTVKVNARTIRVCAKVRDSASYLFLSIDIDTGQITYWEPTTKEQVEAVVGEES